MTRRARAPAEAAGRAVAPLRAFAEELRRAQQDFVLAEQMVSDDEAVALIPGSGAVAVDGAREAMSRRHERHDRPRETGAHRERDRCAGDRGGEDAASPRSPGPAPGPLVGRNGNVGDGLVQALGDVASGSPPPRQRPGSRQRLLRRLRRHVVELLGHRDAGDRPPRRCRSSHGRLHRRSERRVLRPRRTRRSTGPNSRVIAGVSRAQELHQAREAAHPAERGLVTRRHG